MPSKVTSLLPSVPALAPPPPPSSARHSTSMSLVDYAMIYISLFHNQVLMVPWVIHYFLFVFIGIAGTPSALISQRGLKFPNYNIFRILHLPSKIKEMARI